MNKKAKPGVLIIGVGNDYRGDDAAGLLVARSLASSISHRVLELPGEGSELIEAWREESHVIVIDASYSGAPIGKITRIDAGSDILPQGFFNYSTHAFGLAEAVETSRNLNILPEHLVIYAIEGKTFSMGAPVSAETKWAINKVTDDIITELGEVQYQTFT